MKVGVSGCAGRMGREIIKQIIEFKDLQLVAGVERKDSGYVGFDVGEVAELKPIGIRIKADYKELFVSSDVIIDFSLPEATKLLLKAALDAPKPLVIGTTGLDAETEELITKISEKTAVLRASNMSLGVNLLAALVEKAAKALDEDFDIEILEMHHNKKVDAPSGTALTLGKAAANGRNIDFDNATILGNRGYKREKGKIGFAVLRGGDVAGEHDVIFAGENERIILSHKATSRIIFVKGALRAAKWLYDKPAGLYSMNDVLGLSDL